jgi:nucleoside-diphosphate-sugar epimerase
MAGVDCVVHLAGCVHTSTAGAEHDRVNFAGTSTLARSAVQGGVRRLVFLSTIKVHGEGRERPYSESDSCTPHDDYARSKCEAEKALKHVTDGSATQATILRPPLVYGPGVKANFLSLLRLVDRGAVLPLRSVVNRRSVLFVGNLVDAILTALSHPRAAGKTFLVADGEPVSTPDLIRAIAFQLGRPCRLVHCPVRVLRIAGRLTFKQAAVDRVIASFWADTAAIRNSLGWDPPFSLRDGLKETAAWYQNNSLRARL